MSEALDCFRNAHEEEPFIADRIWLGTLLILVTTISYILNSLMLIITMKMSIFDKPFRYHVISMITTSLVYLSAHIPGLIPATIGAVHMQDPWNIILSSTNHLGYLALMFTNTNVAADRFMFFYMKEIQESLGSNITAYAIVASIPWIASILITVGMAFEGCYCRTDPYKLTFSYGCSNCKVSGPLLNYLEYIFPGINFVLYGLVYAEIVRIQMRFKKDMKDAEVKSQNKTIRLVIQFSLMCAIQFASGTCFWALPLLLPNTDLASYLPMVISTLNSMTNPVVMLLFQARVRNAYMTIIKNRSINFLPTAVTIIQQSRSQFDTKTTSTRF